MEEAKQLFKIKARRRAQRPIAGNFDGKLATLLGQDGTRCHRRICATSLALGWVQRRDRAPGLKSSASARLLVGETPVIHQLPPLHRRAVSNSCFNSVIKRKRRHARLMASFLRGDFRCHFLGFTTDKEIEVKKMTVAWLVSAWRNNSDSR